MFKFARGILNFFNGKKKKITLIIIGLDNAGKTTLMNSYKGIMNEDVIPNIGMGLPTTKKISDYEVQILDLGGYDGFRKAWIPFLGEVHGIVFVIDSNDRKRIEEASKEFNIVSSNMNLSQKPILIFANKQDLPQALDESEITKSFNIHELNTNSHKIIRCIAKPSCNNGVIDNKIGEGFEWIISNIHQNYTIINEMVEIFLKQKSTSDEKPKEKPKVVKCSRCGKNPATKNGEATKFEAICDECYQSISQSIPSEPLSDESDPLKPGANLQPAPKTDNSSHPGIPNPKPVAKTIPKCIKDCGRDATHKSEKSGWKPICDECDVK